MPVHMFGRTITQVSVDQDAAGDSDLVSAPGAALKIYVVTIVLLNSHSAVGTLQFKENTTAISGEIQLPVGGGIVITGADDTTPVLQTNTANLKLAITTTTAFVDGWIRYFVA